MKDASSGAEGKTLTYMTPRSQSRGSIRSDDGQEWKGQLRQDVAAGLAWAHGCLDTAVPENIASYYDSTIQDFRCKLKSLWSSASEF